MGFWKKNAAEKDLVEPRKVADLRLAPSNKPLIQGAEEINEVSALQKADTDSLSKESSSFLSPEAPRKARLVVAKGISLSAQLYFDNPTVVDGDFQGRLTSTSSVHINPEAVVRADLSVNTLIVEGQVYGNVKAQERVEIRPGGVVEGTVTAPSLEVSDGGVVSGSCEIAA